jgi:hypothetical protein
MSADHAAGAVSRQTVQTIAGAFVAVVVFQVIFGVSYISALHNPKPHGIPLAVAAPTTAAAEQAAAQVRSTAGDAVSVRIAPSAAVARRWVFERRADAAYVVETSGATLFTASAASLGEAQLLKATFTQAAAEQKKSLTVTDLVPLPRADSRGLGPFYLALTWIVGGYLGATLLGLLRGYAAFRRRHAVLRLAALAAYSVVSAVVLATVVDLAIGVGGGHLLPAIAIGALVVFATSLASAGLQAVFGLAGTAAVLIVFVAIGNPSSGGPASYHLLPAFHRAVGPYFINGAATDLLRNTFYFDADAIARPLIVLGVWGLVGAAAMLIVGDRRQRLDTRTEMALAAVAAAGA